MRIRVERVDTTPSGVTRVFFVCPVGRAHGQWMEAVPAVNSEHEVELDIPGTLIWGEHINVTEASTPVIVERQGDTLVFGTLQSFDGGVAELRLGDQQVLVEVDRVTCQLPCSVEITIHHLRLFDANV